MRGLTDGSSGDQMATTGRWSAGQWKSLLLLPACLACFVAFNIFTVGVDGRLQPEFWWHLQYGARIVTDGAIPARDWMSWTFEGEPYRTTQWLGQVLLFLGWSTFGAPGTAGLTMLAAAAVYATAFLLVKRELGSAMVAAALATFMTGQFWSLDARPQIFAFVAMAVLVLVAEQARTSWGGRQKLVFFGSTALVGSMWANLHGSFSVGLAYLLICAASEIGPVWAKHGRAYVLRARWEWAVAPVTFAVGTLCNPYGIGSWVYAVEVAGLLTTKLGLIMEWNPTSLITAEGTSFILLSLATFVGWSTSAKAVEPSRVVQAVLVVLLGLLANRLSWFCAIAMLPLAACAAGGSALLQRLTAALPGVVSGWVMAAGVGVAVALGAVKYQALETGTRSAMDSEYPVGAAEFIREHKLQGKLFNEGGDGGWLSYHLGVKVGLDTRLDLFKDEHVLTWASLRQGAPLWRRHIEKFDADIYLLRSSDALVSLLTETEIAVPVHVDRGYTVLLKNSQQNRELIGTKRTVPLVQEVFDEQGRLQVRVKSW